MIDVILVPVTFLVLFLFIIRMNALKRQRRNEIDDGYVAFEDWRNGSPDEEVPEDAVQFDMSAPPAKMKLQVIDVEYMDIRPK